MLAQWLAWRLRIPAIVLLTLTGVLVGPVFGLIRPSEDFGELLGMCITGKLLSNYNKPLKQLHELMDCVCVLYLDTIPIASGGFDIKNISDATSLLESQKFFVALKM